MFGRRVGGWGYNARMDRTTHAKVGCFAALFVHRHGHSHSVAASLPVTHQTPDRHSTHGSAKDTGANPDTAQVSNIFLVCEMLHACMHAKTKYTRRAHTLNQTRSTTSAQHTHACAHLHVGYPCVHCPLSLLPSTASRKNEPRT